MDVRGLSIQATTNMEEEEFYKESERPYVALNQDNDETRDLQ